MKLKVTRLHSSATLPTYQHATDAGLDLTAVEEVDILPGESKLVRTGLAIELPPNTEAQVRPRSGLALKHQITVLNSPGTIDAGYRGEIGIVLINHGEHAFHVTVGMRIAQMVIAPVTRVSIEEVVELAESDRGAGGFGSTGTHVQTAVAAH
ncbi:MAG: dUTP diphosphatase [Cyanobacteria bacterium J06641_5]